MPLGNPQAYGNPMMAAMPGSMPGGAPGGPMPGMISPQGGGIQAALKDAKRKYMEAANAPAQDPTQMKAKNALMAELAKTIQNLSKMESMGQQGAVRA